jgi:hypothetical protein
MGVLREVLAYGSGNFEAVLNENLQKFQQLP